MSRTTSARERRDACPGVLRPWPAEDGALVRVRLVGGRITRDQLVGLSRLAQDRGDGDLHLTSRANLQLRGLPSDADGTLPAVVERVEALGLLPSRSHDQVRNVLVSVPVEGPPPCGRIDPWPLAVELERLLLADPRTTRLPGKFLLGLDDGRGDLLAQTTDLLLVALDEHSFQVRVGETWGESVSLANGPRLLVHLATEFLRLRGDGPDAPWHVVELARPLMPAYDADPRVPAPAAPPSYDERHREVPDGRLPPAAVEELVGGLAGNPVLVVTPWRGILLP